MDRLFVGVSARMRSSGLVLVTVVERGRLLMFLGRLCFVAAWESLAVMSAAGMKVRCTIRA